MLYLKKYFTEGLIQFTILLSLVGVRVDVDTYLPSPLRLVSGPGSASTQTQFRHLRDTLDGYGARPKSADLDSFFSVRRLLRRLRSPRDLRVPSTQLSAWLVHRDPDAGVIATGQSGPGTALDDGGGPEDVSGPEASGMRGAGGAPESGPGAGEGPAAAAPETGREQRGPDELSKEDIDLIDILWRQDIDLGAGREVFDYAGRQKDGETGEPEGEAEDTGEGGGPRPRNTGAVDGETGESVPEQLSSLGAQTSMSLQECLRLLEATFPFGEESEFRSTETAPPLRGEAEGVPSTSRGLPLAAPPPQPDAPLDLEQQWQDIMAIMGLQDMEVNRTGSGALDDPSVDTGCAAAPPPGLINEDVSLHQASLFEPPPGPSVDGRPALLAPASGDPPAAFGVADLTGLFLAPLPGGAGCSATAAPPPDPFSGLLEESMLDEISLLDLALEEGFSPARASRLEDELDSDSGLSLGSGRSPASPGDSEASCSSSSASCSSTSATSCSSASCSSTSATFSEEACRAGLGDPAPFRGVEHNHTYDLPPRPGRPRAPGPCGAGPGELPRAPRDLPDRQSGRDERRARALKIPFSNEKIVHLPVEEFNELLAAHRLSPAQLSLVRDIRRRGKNKMAAQNCRKRKLDTIAGLEQGVQELRRDRARLLREKADFLGRVAQMKQRVQGLYQEVFGQLRDPPGEHALQLALDAAERGRRPDRKQKDKKK